MQRILFYLAVIVLAGCKQKEKYTEQEKYTEPEKYKIEQEANATLRKTEILIDSVTKVNHDVQQRTHYSYTVTVNETLIKNLEEYEKTLYMALNELEPNYDSLKVIIENYKMEHLVTKRMMSKFDEKPNL